MVKPHFDGVLLRTLTVFKNEERTTRQWWSVCGHFAGSILPTDSVRAVLDVEDDWSSVKDAVWAVYNSSVCGKQLMARAVRQLEIALISKLVCEHIEKLTKEDDVTKVVIEGGQEGLREGGDDRQR